MQKHHPAIVIIFGLPGTGKTYLSEKLAENLGAIHLNTDKIRHKLHKTNQYDKETKNYIYEEMQQEMEQHLQHKNTVIVDGTFYQKSKRKKFIQTAEKYKTPVFLIQLKARESIVKDRLNKSRKYSKADFDIYHKIKTQFDPVERPHLVLWSDNKNGSKLLNEAKHYLNGN